METEAWQNDDEDLIEEELTLDEWKERDRNRDNYFRCKHCGHLWHHRQCILDTKFGYLCPHGCKEEFDQPDYESPLN